MYIKEQKKQEQEQKNIVYSSLLMQFMILMHYLQMAVFSIK